MRLENKEFNEQGYILIKNFFPVESIELVQTEAKEVFLKQFLALKLIESPVIDDSVFESTIVRLFNEHFENYINCGKQAQHLISLHQLSLNKSLTERLNELGLGFPVISTRPVMYFNKSKLAKSEEFYKVPPHQDWRSMQGSLNSIVVWVPLCDIDESLGALKVIPGSHRMGLLDSSENAWFRQINEVDKKDFISVTVDKGDALFFSSFLIHASGDNIQDKIRWSCHFRYNDLNEETFIKRGYPNPYIYKPVQDLITPGFPKREQLQNVFL